MSGVSASPHLLPACACVTHQQQGDHQCYHSSAISNPDSTTAECDRHCTPPASLPASCEVLTSPSFFLSRSLLLLFFLPLNLLLFSICEHIIIIIIIWMLSLSGVFESWLHPSRYRTQLCKDQEKCDRPVCFFAHNIKELRTPVDSFVPHPEERLRVPEAMQVSS